MSDQTEENNDDLSMKDVFVLSVVATPTIMGVGAIARLGYDPRRRGHQQAQGAEEQEEPEVTVSQTKSP